MLIFNQTTSLFWPIKGTVQSESQGTTVYRAFRLEIKALFTLPGEQNLETKPNLNHLVTSRHHLYTLKHPILRYIMNLN